MVIVRLKMYDRACSIGVSSTTCGWEMLLGSLEKGRKDVIP